MINKISMRWFFVPIFLGLGIMSSQAQTSIGKIVTEGTDVLLDFKEGENRGIILPWVTMESDVNAPVGGTLIFDSHDKKVKYYQEGTSATWVDLSIKEGAVDLSIQQAAGEVATHVPAVIGNPTTSVSGVLVLESSNKAMVLPKMESPHLNILSPQAGTIAFDTKSKMLCIFNGREWSFWKVKN